MIGKIQRLNLGIMEKWKGKVALVTGCTAGIGKSIAQDLVKHDMKVVACARDYERLKKISKEANKIGPGEIYPVRCDVSSEVQVVEMFRQVREKYGVVHACINNAGIAHSAPLLSGSVADWASMMSVNVIGVCLCTREAVKLMNENSVEDGHVIHINSMSGHRVRPSVDLSFYAGTKHAITALAKGLRNELRLRGSKIRVSCVSPGMVETEFAYRLYSDNPERAEAKYAAQESMTAGDISEAVIYALSAPSRVDVCDILIKPTDQKF